MVLGHTRVHSVYLLNGKRPRDIYIGYSPNPHRRLRQHNGEIAGGAAPAGGQPYSLQLIVSGFATEQSALQFEAAWQKPTVCITAQSL